MFALAVLYVDKDKTSSQLSHVVIHAIVVTSSPGLEIMYPISAL